MIDDPLSLLSLSIWLMAAGMWPVGFLFGACSACCDECGECPCPPNCDFTCDTGNKFKNIKFNGRVGEFTFDETDFVPFPSRDENGDFFQDVFSIELPAGLKRLNGATFLELGNQGWGYDLGIPLPECIDKVEAVYLTLGIGFGTSQDDCGCPICLIFFDPGISVDLGQEPRRGAVLLSAAASPIVRSCDNAEWSPSSITYGDWTPDAGANGIEEWDDDGSCGSEQEAYDIIKAWLDENFVVEIENLQVQQSCCNKCTHATNGCNPTATILSYEVEDYGSNQIENPGPEPAGSCFDNSVSFEIEQLPETSLAYFGEQCITPISLSPFLSEPDGCGCSACCFEVVFQAQFNFENDGFARFEAVAFLCFDGCDQTEATTAQLTEWSVVDEQGPTAELLEFLNSLNLSATLTVEPCDCGACCDEGCEDNVAEGGCENWAGVGTSCCDDPDPCAEE
jgi:hypothetical protein